MIAIITGDIINSKEDSSLIWLKQLKEVLGCYGKTPGQWQIYRGDSFQLKIESGKALLAAFHIKAVIKQSKSQDVRMSLGIGEEAHVSEKITESNGSAYIRSGECFELLKKQTLAIQSSDKVIDQAVNLMLKISSLTTNHWSKTVAKIIALALKHPEKQQTEIANIIHKSQSSVSEAMKRGGFEELMSINRYYQTQISLL
jgi:hypothetical protein